MTHLFVWGRKWIIKLNYIVTFCLFFYCVWFWERCLGGAVILEKEMYLKQNFILTDKIDQYCIDNPTAIVKHPGNCGWYYNCSNRDSTIGKYIQECRYPELFSTITKKCEEFTDVNCISRHEPLAPCK